jgi:hypothetical protein
VKLREVEAEVNAKADVLPLVDRREVYSALLRYLKTKTRDFSLAGYAALANPAELSKEEFEQLKLDLSKKGA